MKPVPTSEPVVTACGGNAAIAVRTEFGVGLRTNKAIEPFRVPSLAPEGDPAPQEQGQ